MTRHPTSNGQRRVLAVIDRFWPNIGGGERMAALLNEGLHDRGCRVDVLTRQYHPDLPSVESIRGSQVTRKGGSRFRRISKGKFTVAATRHMVRVRRDYDLVHVHCCQGETDLLPTFLAWLITRVPYVVHVHSAVIIPWMLRLRDDHPLVRESRMNVVPRWVWIRALQSAAAVIVPDPGSTELLRRHGVGRVRCVPNGVRMTSQLVEDAERTKLRARLSLPENAWIVVFAGVLRPPKNVMTLLRAWKQLTASRRIRPLRLLIVGGTDTPSHSSEGELRAYTRVQQLDSVTFTGFVQNVDEYLRAADVFAFPSILEGMPLAVLEAMSHGIPVIVSDIAANRQLVPSEEYGLLFNAMDTTGLAERLARLLDNPTASRQLGARGRARVCEHFSITRTVDSLLEIYRGIGRGARRPLAGTPPARAARGAGVAVCDEFTGGR